MSLKEQPIIKCAVPMVLPVHKNKQYIKNNFIFLNSEENKKLNAYRYIDVHFANIYKKYQQNNL